MALKTINNIPQISLQIFADGSRVVGEISSSGVHILTPTKVRNIRSKIQIFVQFSDWSLLLPERIALLRFMRSHIKALICMPGSQDISEVPQLLCRFGLPCPRILTCLYFKKNEALLNLLMFLEFLDLFWIHGDCLALLDNLGVERSNDNNYKYAAVGIKPSVRF
ncbi:hypothetical protein TNCV_4763691 [Trichonephila clavipes]|nr:hypothetical protein TNCV_4763691 [Trichonephila clavipes]